MLQGFDLAYPKERVSIPRMILMAGNRLDKWMSGRDSERPNQDFALGEQAENDSRSVVSRGREFLPLAGALSNWSVRLRGIDRSLKRVKKFLQETPGGKPILLFLNIMEAHEPYGLSLGNSDSLLGRGVAPTNSLSTYSSSMTSRPGVQAFRSTIVDGYLDGLRSADDALQKTLGMLSKRLDMSESMLVVLSDHGQALGERGYFGHGSHLYDELVYVPCIVKGKGDKLASIGQALSRDWIDHRHIHDFLATVIEDGIELPQRHRIGDIMEHRGTAKSFVRSPHSTYQTARSKTGSSVSRLRLESGESHAIVESKTYQLNSLETAGPDGSKLQESAIRLLSDILGTNSDSRISTLDSVESRLGSWGYL
jgi:hypothetical protein